MKKYAWILCFVLLLSCEGQSSQVKSYRLKQETLNAIDQREDSYIDDDVLKDLVKIMNEAFSVVDIEYHHGNLEKVLLEVLDFSQTYESQEALIEEMTKSYFEKWHRATVDAILNKESMILSETDYETMFKKTSVASAYTLMLAYEKVYFKRLFE